MNLIEINYNVSGESCVAMLLIDATKFTNDKELGAYLSNRLETIRPGAKFIAWLPWRNLDNNGWFVEP